MTGWDIFRKSVGQIYYNLGDAIRISGLLWVISSINNLAPSPFDAATGMPSLSAMLLNAVVLVVDLGCIMWIAVLWHRFMLLEEEVNSYLPKWHPEQLWAYLKVAFIIMLIIVAVSIIPAVIYSYVSNALFEFSTWLHLAVSLTMVTILYYFSLRISLSLPAIAVDKPIGIGESWRLTEPDKGAILVASIILVLFSVAIGLPFGLADFGDGIGFITSFITDWISIMLGVSILTTLYGHLVENRPLG